MSTSAPTSPRPLIPASPARHIVPLPSNRGFAFSPTSPLPLTLPLALAVTLAVACALLLTSSRPARAAAEPLPQPATVNPLHRPPPASATTRAHPIATTDTVSLAPDLEISLFAAEPDVVDPVALCFDELGLAYVVEMRDYPYGLGPDRQPAGSIRCLEDTDGDGRADRSVVFASELRFPTSITPWNGGVLVTAPPHIVFLQDTDGDRRADHREVVVSGFKLGVTDSNVNGLRYGLDNWIHGANGGNGGTLASPRRPGATLRLGEHDFRFRVATGQIEITTHTGGGFGLVFDDWGRSFTTYNIDHLQQRVADAEPFQRHPGLPPVQTTHSISDHGEMARIYPVSTAVTRPNHPEQAGHFSAAGGMGYLGHTGWPAHHTGSLFVGDVVGNLVHRDRLHPDGPIFRAARAPGETNREFFASPDNAFRPVGLELGPDGALYLLDMQRDVIEHPDYIPKKLLRTLDVRAGEDRGRIYRLAPRGWPKDRTLPGRAAPSELVALFDSPNAWTRGTAQRLLVTRQDRSVTGSLQKAASSPNPRARLHALATLDGLGSLSDSTLATALHDPEPALRIHALRLAAARINPGSNPDASARLLPLLSDPDPEVRFVAAQTVGRLAPPPVAELVAMLHRDAAWPWSRRAALAALGPHTVQVMERFFADPAYWADTTRDRTPAAREFMEVAAGSADAATARAGLPLPAGFGAFPMPLRIAVLEGFARGLSRRSSPATAAPDTERLLRALTENDSEPALLGVALHALRGLGLPLGPTLDRQLPSWTRRVLDRALPTSERVNGVPLLTHGAWTNVGPTLLTLLQPDHPHPLRQAALQVLREFKEPAVGTALIAAWPSISPTERPALVNLLVYRHGFHEALLHGLESESIRVGELNLDLEHRRELLRKAAPPLRARAARFMADEEYSNRTAVVEQWLARMPESGDRTRGRAVFEKLCAQCHQAHGLGFQVGPDLSGLGHRSVEDLLSNILDPNMAMNPAFVAFTAELADGESETGILASDGTETVLLLQAGGRKVELPRSQIRRLGSEGRSLMPEGLEAGLEPRDLRDVIAFLQAPTP